MPPLLPGERLGDGADGALLDGLLMDGGELILPGVDGFMREGLEGLLMDGLEGLL
jgi:hypothetical protein